MGWSSGGDIFDPVARALTSSGADDHVRRVTLAALIEQLQEGDWDSEDESVAEFRDDPLIVELFRRAGVGDEMWSSNARGVLNFDNGRWWLRCGGRHTDTLADADGTAAEHDRLVHVWAAHDRDFHGGDGAVDNDMLIHRTTEG